MMLRMTHTFYHLGLILMGKEKGWQVLVAAGQGMRMSGQNPMMRAAMMMMVRRKRNLLMWNKLLHPPICTWGLLLSGSPKTKLVREKRKENPRIVEKEVGIDYRFHTAF
jgi:hypothetical protein